MRRPAVTFARTDIRWTARLVPVVPFSAIIFSLYAVVVHACVNVLIRKRRMAGVAAAIIVLFLIFFFLTVSCYVRVILTAMYNPGLVPLRGGVGDSEKGFGTRTGTGTGGSPDTGPDMDPDSPGLEEFYSRDVFVCKSDGRPQWCHDCQNWKPDRAHHSSDLNRCVWKMDHFCPWVGGVVSETSYKYFTQFTFYGSLYLAVCLATGVYCFAAGSGSRPRPDVVAIILIALSSFFGLFSFVMLCTAVRFILLNTTNIDALRRNQVFQLAVHVPHGTPPTEMYSTVTYPLPKPAAPRPLLPEYSESQQTAAVNGQADQAGEPSHDSDGGGGARDAASKPAVEPVTERDRRAQRTFAILRTEAGENPWDLGMCRNWRSVMGDSLADNLLPLRPSPCAGHDDIHSLYPMGHVLDSLKHRYGIERLAGMDGGLAGERQRAGRERRSGEKRRSGEMSRPGGNVYGTGNGNGNANANGNGTGNGIGRSLA